MTTWKKRFYASDVGIRYVSKEDESVFVVFDFEREVILTHTQGLSRACIQSLLAYVEEAWMIEAILTVYLA